MGCKLRILTIDEIEEQVRACSGTWLKRSNLRKKLIAQRLEIIDFLIDEIRKEIRRCKASSMAEKDLRYLYSFKSKIERMRIL